MTDAEQAIAELTLLCQAHWEETRDASIETALMLQTIVALLVQKKVFTADEFHDAKVKLTAEFDQNVAEWRDEE